MYQNVVITYRYVHHRYEIRFTKVTLYIGAAAWYDRHRLSITDTYSNLIINEIKSTYITSG